MNEIIKALLEIQPANKKPCEALLNRDEIINVLNDIRSILFLGYFENCYCESEDYVMSKLLKIKNKLLDIFQVLYCDKNKSLKVIIPFLETIPIIKQKLETDIEAFLNSDPAATNRDEIILSYPGIYAITVHRIAHEFYRLNVSSIARIMSEHAHSKTGIDIHPGAQIGEYFFIDHGTGTVIGETAKIGKHVKIYQGVTLGALSLSNAKSLKGVKRHPTILDNVTIYSGASILGGDTVIGYEVTIGSNVYLTKSVEDRTTVILKSPEVIHKNKTKM